MIIKSIINKKKKQQTIPSTERISVLLDKPNKTNLLGEIPIQKISSLLVGSFLTIFFFKIKK